MSDVKRRDAIQGDIIHEYDGIEEADNQLPTWWLWTLYLAMAFGVVYWFAYHEYDAASLPMQAYQENLAAKQQGGGDVSGEELLAMAEDPQAVSAGKEVFATNCVACHGAQGEGQIGPNLTDDHWIHGGSAESIHETIANGIQAKGMPAWSSTLGSVKVQQATAYVLTMRGTDVPGKPPEGEVWMPEAQAEEDAEAEADGDEAGGAEAGAEAADDDAVDEPAGATEQAQPPGSAPPASSQKAAPAEPR